MRVRKFSGLIPKFIECAGERLVRGVMPPILIRVKVEELVDADRNISIRFMF